MIILHEIEIHSANELERTKYALSLNEVLCPVQCVLANINPRIYYNIFIVINRGKVKRINELEKNFKVCPMDLF